MPNDIKPDTAKIPVLYFDADGLGPDHLFLEVQPIRGDEVMAPSLSLRVRAAGLVMRAPVDGGYFLQREQVTPMFRALGGWLDEVHAGPSLGEQLYGVFVAQQRLVAGGDTPNWASLPSSERDVWDAVASKARAVLR